MDNIAKKDNPLKLAILLACNPNRTIFLLPALQADLQI
jgi:hypothetical protein